MVAAAQSQFQAGWAELGLTAAAVQTTAGVGAVQDLVADIVSVWGEVAGSVAADFYEELRAQAAPAGGRFAAIVPDPLNRGQTDAATRWALTPPRGEDIDLDSQLAKLEGSIQRLIRQGQREVIQESAARDQAAGRVRVARVPMGSTTCAFCLVLASRGYVYRSATSAGQDNRFHDWCDCELDVSWDPRPTPPDGYDPGELYGRFEQAREAADGRSLRAILKQLRLQEGIR